MEVKGYGRPAFGNYMSVKDQAKDKSNYALIAALIGLGTAYFQYAEAKEIKAGTAKTDENISEAMSTSYDDLSEDLEELKEDVLILRWSCGIVVEDEVEKPPLAKPRATPKRKSFKEQYRIDIPTKTWKK